MKRLPPLLICTFLFLLAENVLFAQQIGMTSDSVAKDLNNLSLEQLLGVKIESVSKKTESLFYAPLSASVVSREEIQKAGSTSIMEALRLIPGMIVREVSNGNYDIHLRGMDNIPPNASFDITSNTTTLVMIDSRPVYSYLSGGTFWETLPVDLNDVEKIEVIRGPAAALYGPNAVNGVINIITRQPAKKGVFLVANTKAGSQETKITNASLGYRITDHFNMVASGNYQYRDRAQTSYFEYNRNTWLDHPEYFLSFSNDTVRKGEVRYPDQGFAMKKYAGNIFVNYRPSSGTHMELSTGMQHSVAQRISAETEITPLAIATSDTRYIDVRAGVKNVSAQFSYNQGTQITELDPGNKFDFHTINAHLYYNFVRGNFSIKPGIHYSSAVYDDTKYSDIIHHAGIFNARGEITNKSASFNAEYNALHKKLRLIAAVSTNTFNYPDTTYLAYELAATYNLNKKHLLRAVYSQAPRSSNIRDTYVDQAVVFFPSGNQSFTEYSELGNKNLKLLTATMMEIGYRGNLSPRLNIDLELFHIRSNNHNSPVESKPITEISGSDTIHETPYQFTNLPLILFQEGATVSLSYTAGNIQVKPFITIQQTTAKNYAPYMVTPDALSPGAQQYNIYSAMGRRMLIKSTPTLYGGGTVNYAFHPKWNINISAYGYSAQTFTHLTKLYFNDGVRGTDHIAAKLILNANLGYQPVKGLRIFLTGKNLLGDRSREFFRTDKIPLMVLTGLHFEL
jgi:iron complex outermembrane receptor protein